MNDSKRMSQNALNMANKMHELNLMDNKTFKTVRNINDDFSLKNMDSEQIRALRKRESVSQGVLAKALGMSVESVKKWEKGNTTPSGASLRLLNIIDAKGIDAVML